jgi:transcriptional regulator with XRE-family HTH domain
MGNIGENIKMLRKSRGMSQEQLGDRIGKTRSAISQYEHGEIIPRMGVIEKLSEVFRVSKHEIIGGYEYEMVDFPTYGEQELMDIYRSLDERDKRRLLDIAKTFK